MKCVFCGSRNTEVIETRVLEEGGAIRRRRRCVDCQKRFTTYERVETFPVLVIKRDGRRERFNRDKLRQGILKATEKTVVSAQEVEDLVKRIESEIKQRELSEIESRVIGEMVAEELKKIDKIAYIRFASVFKRFVDLEDLQKEIKKL